MIKLHEYFEKFGMRKDFFARKIGTTPTTLSSWLSGKTVPKIKYGIEIEKITNGFVKMSDWIK